MITEELLDARMKRFAELCRSQGQDFIVGIISTFACVATDEEWNCVIAGALEIAAHQKVKP